MANIIDILKQKKQIILQGAPGTGKTYTTAELAVAMIDGSASSNRVELMARYKSLIRDRRIFFTTFHQSMDYEEFIEGYKPDGEKFLVQNGIFKVACNAAESALLIKTKDNKKTLEEALEAFCNDILNDQNNQREDDYVLFRLKTIKKGTEFNVRVKNEKLQLRMGTKDKVWYYPNIKDYYQDKNYKKVWLNSYTPSILEYLYQNYNLVKYDDLQKIGCEETTESKDVILIIDEINRGNISKIFGELITLLEADKRAGALNEIELKLPYSGEYFSVPPNLYIIGTMNTADRTIGYIDYALRRRFAFITIKSEREKCSDIAKGLFDEVCKIVCKENMSSEFEADDLMIGHSYFMASDKAALEMKLEYEIKPLLLEYLKDGILIDKDNLKDTIKNLSV